MDNARAEEKDMMSIYNAYSGKTEKVQRVVRADSEWKSILTPEQYRITRLKGTEAPSVEKCEINTDVGIYKCVGCGTDLFSVGEKFESGTGWPSFWKPVSDLNVKEEADNSLGIERTEISCARCGAHLGHVFEDGPAPTYKRYCINSVALKWSPQVSANPKPCPRESITRLTKK